MDFVPHEPSRDANGTSLLAFVRVNDVGYLSPVSYYRVYQPANAIGQHSKHHRVEILSQRDVGAIINRFGKSAGFLEGRDIYLLSRLYRRSGLRRMLKVIHDSGGLVVFDTDDDLTEEHRHIDGRGDEFIYMANEVDLVTVSTPYLARQMKQHIGYTPTVLPNHIDCEWFSRISLATEKRTEQLTVGFVGTTSHYGDWKYPVDALRALNEEFANLRILVAGYCPDYLTDMDRVIELPAVPYSQYPGIMRQFDIVCCSLDVDDKFNQSKSSVKALEAMAAARYLSNGKLGGAVPVCTDMPVYRRTVSNRHNGLLVSNHGWYDALHSLITDRHLLEELATQGHKWVRKHRNIANGYGKWTRIYKQLLRSR